MKHANISIFVPHIGCTNSCIFCNQRSISGKSNAPTPEYVEDLIGSSYQHLKEKQFTAQIAFFGGSFTAIDRTYMISLLEAASKFIDHDIITGIRISTRPDCINQEIIDILKHYGVNSIELGVQSLSQRVLDLNQRGHLASAVEESAELIKKNGIELGLQMMTGLYGDTYEETIKTAQGLIDLKPATVRIYPTVVIRNTFLGKLYRNGHYVPQTLEEAVEICSRLLMMFFENNIDVIRLGLHASELLEQDKIAGPYHPAFKELCENKIYFDKAVTLLQQKGSKEQLNIVCVASDCVSKIVGQGKKNVEMISEMGYNIKIKGLDEIKKYEVYLKDFN